MGFFFKSHMLYAKFYDHLGKNLLLVIIYVFNFKQNWIKPMHKDGGFFLVKQMFHHANSLEIITVIESSVGPQ